MSKKTTLGKAVNLFHECKQLMEGSDLKNAELRMEVYFLMSEVEKQAKALEESKKPLFKKYGKEITEGQFKGQISIEPENLQEYNKALEPIIDKSVTVKETVSKKLLLKLESSVPQILYEFMK